MMHDHQCLLLLFILLSTILFLSFFWLFTLFCKFVEPISLLISICEMRVCPCYPGYLLVCGTSELLTVKFYHYYMSQIPLLLGNFCEILLFGY
jgi:hypothetical protein